MINQRTIYLLGISVLFLVQISFAQAEDQQDKLKALFLYKFTEYVTWPEESEEIRMGVLSSNNVLAQLQAYQLQRPHLKVIDVKSPDDVDGLHILFLSKAAAAEYKQFMKPLVGKSTLVVCEDKNDMRWGVDIAFIENQTRMSYMVDQSSLERRKLVASGKLLGMGSSR